MKRGGMRCAVLATVGVLASFGPPTKVFAAPVDAATVGPTTSVRPPLGPSGAGGAPNGGDAGSSTGGNAAGAISANAPTLTGAIPLHASVQGTELHSVELGAAPTPGARRTYKALTWGDLARNNLPTGLYAVRFQVAGGERVAVEIPVCSGRGRVLVNGTAVPTAGNGPVVVPLPPRPERAHDVEIEIHVGAYEHRIVCGQAPKFGAQIESREGLGLLSFASPHAAAGGGKAVVFIPPGHDIQKPSALLVGTHPWNGTMWTYGAYADLLREAAARDVVLLMPSGLGNSLYTAAAEDEVMRAIDTVSQAVAVDPRRISIWGASMGGAGATTIGFHHPDKFASVTSFFGDSKYDTSTYVKSILPNEAAAHLVNALDVAENGRHVAVWLVHGDDDRVSPPAQSAMLARVLRDRGFAVRHDRVPHMGHDGALVARFIAEVVGQASEARVPATVSRVTYRSVRPVDTGAYGVKIARSGIGDAFVDIERRGETVHVLAASGVRSIEFARGALGTSPMTPPPITMDPNVKVEVRWEGISVPASVMAPVVSPSPR
ncbi:prolyl oligopeptidase family serine peptidase [Pendulispora brunnea]|uniref:Prolyl oligopeptidase family serine peptidase n=1 Tax=Pendulispora brunnea TaxID=2905690 RepID=A0ABZ2K5I6_9BACT